MCVRGRVRGGNRIVCQCVRGRVMHWGAFPHHCRTSKSINYIYIWVIPIVYVVSVPLVDGPLYSLVDAHLFQSVIYLSSLVDAHLFQSVYSTL